MASTDNGEYAAASDPVEKPERWSCGIRAIDIACFFLLLWPVAALVIWFTAPSYLYQFLNAIEASPASGDFWWSLFGRADDCCGYVNHNDGYSLHYPGDTLDMRDAVVYLTQHAYTMTNLTLGNWTDSIADIAPSVLPIVQCPQNSLM